MLSYLLEHHRYLNIIGITLVLFIATLFSYKRTHVNTRLVRNALIMQFLIALFILKTSWGMWCIQRVADGVATLYQSAETGIEFLFGGLAKSSGPWGFVFAIKVLPVIICFGAFTAILFYFGIIQRMVMLLNRVIQPLLGTSGAESLCAATNSFLGQTEAPLLIRQYLGRMTASELLVVMVSGMGTMSGAIIAVYAMMGVPIMHLLAASVMAVPSTILIAKILYPETERPETLRNELRGDGSLNIQADNARNVVDAIARGTSDGLQLAMNVGAMLIVFIALIGLVNTFLGLFASGITWICSTTVCSQFGISWQMPALTLSMILGWIFAPVAWLMGIPSAEVLKAGSIIGTKVAINEMFAYIDLLASGLSERTVILLTYALCGFSNIACIGIQVGGIGALAPEKRSQLAAFGLSAVLGGTLSNLLCAFMAGLLI